MQNIFNEVELLPFHQQFATYYAKLYNKFYNNK